MSFFEPPPRLPEPPPGPPVPDWLAPPENVLPASFPLELVLARTDELALSVHSGRAYENGFEFTLGLHRRTPLEPGAHDPMMLWHAARQGQIDEAALRFGVPTRTAERRPCSTGTRGGATPRLMRRPTSS